MDTTEKKVIVKNYILKLALKLSTMNEKLISSVYDDFKNELKKKFYKSIGNDFLNKIDDMTFNNLLNKYLHLNNYDNIMQSRLSGEFNTLRRDQENLLVQLKNDELDVIIQYLQELTNF
jgi:hypothetical protein